MCAAILDAEGRRPLAATDLAEVFGPERVTFTSHLAVAPSSRGRTVTSLLVEATVHNLVTKGIDVDVCYCSLGLVPMYYQIGSRPYAPRFHLEGAGTRVPLAYCAKDLGYLRQVESPTLQMLGGQVDDGGAAAARLSEHCSEFHSPGFDPHSTKAVWAHLAKTGPDTELRSDRLFEGFEPDQLAKIMAKVSRLKLKAGDFVYRRGESEPGMGVVVSGNLGVSVGEGDAQRYVAVLGPGEPFGEVVTLRGGKRSADLEAMDDASIILHPDVPGWPALQRFCVESQGQYGGDRRIGRKLLGLGPGLGLLGALGCGDASLLAEHVEVLAGDEPVYLLAVEGLVDQQGLGHSVEDVRMMFDTMRRADLYPPLCRAFPDLEREAVQVVLRNGARASAWDQVAALVQEQGSIGNAEVRTILRTDDPVRASKTLRGWVHAGLLEPVNPSSAKQHRRYTSPEQRGARTLPLSSSRRGKQGHDEP